MAAKQWEMKDAGKDTGRVEALFDGVVALWCLSADGRDLEPAHLTPAQARRVARALLRFADGAR